MAENKSKLYNFFFADGFRIAVNIIILLGLIFFGTVVYKTYSRKRSNFKLLFIIMLNVMISTILSSLGYIFNWKVDNGSEKKVLLFNDGVTCIIQSFLLNFFQTSRESFLTLLTFIVFLYFKNQTFDLNKVKNLYKIAIYLFCYGIPLIASIIYMSIGAFGESHLFCFTKLENNSPVPITAIIHYIYLILLVLLNIIFTLYITIKDSCTKNNYQNDAWLEEEEKEEKKCCCLKCLNPLLLKIIFYPIAQLVCLSLPFAYRFIAFFFKKNPSLEVWAGLAAVLNSLSIVIYTFIFMFSNNLLPCCKIDNEKIRFNSCDELEYNISKESD